MVKAITMQVMQTSLQTKSTYCKSESTNSSAKKHYLKYVKAKEKLKTSH